MNHRILFGALVAFAALGACSDDEDAAVSVAQPSADAGPQPEPSGDAASVDASTRLPSYVVPGTESMAAITIDPATGTFYVDSAESGKFYRGVAGATSDSTLELAFDLTFGGITSGGHMAITPDAKRLLVLPAALGGDGRLRVVDIGTRSVVRTVELASTGPFAILQDVAVAPDGAHAYVTSSVENVIHVIDLATYATTKFPISSEFPFISDAAQGFLNATGIAVTSDSKNLLVVHLIDKHIYRVSVEPSTLGKATRLDTEPYNVSGNGLWLGKDNALYEVASDEVRVYRFALDSTATKAPFEARYQSDIFEPGLTYAVAHDDRVLVLNGNGVSLTAGGGPGGVGPGGDGGLPEAGPGDAGFPGFGVDAGARKFPIKVLQVAR